MLLLLPIFISILLFLRWRDERIIQHDKHTEILEKIACADLDPDQEDRLITAVTKRDMFGV